MDPISAGLLSAIAYLFSLLGLTVADALLDALSSLFEGLKDSLGRLLS